MSTPPSTPGPDQDPQRPAADDAPRYGVRLPGYGQNASPTDPNASGSPAQGERPGWDASPRDAAQPPQYGQPAQGGYTLPPAPADPYGHGISVQPSGVYAGYQQPGPAGPVPPRPSTARWASLLLAIGAVAYLILSVVQMLTMDAASMRQAVLSAVPAEMHDQYASMLTDQMINSTKVGAVIILAVVCALAGLVAWLTYRGQNAWRIVGTVCGALAVLGNLSSGLVGLLFAALAAAVIVLWWLRPSNQWFAAVSQAKRRGY